MQNRLGRLSETEIEVMREIWAMDAPVTVSRVLEIFSARRGWKTSTLSTIMDRLIEKGFLCKAIHGKMNIYTPTLTQDMYKKHETHMFLSSVHNGDVKSFIAALADARDIDTEDIAEIQAWFSEKAGDV